MKNHDLTIMTQDAVIWQYNICCPNCCPAQIFSSVLWKTQYIRLCKGLWCQWVGQFYKKDWAFIIYEYCKKTNASFIFRLQSNQLEVMFASSCNFVSSLVCFQKKKDNKRLESMAHSGQWTMMYFLHFLSGLMSSFIQIIIIIQNKLGRNGYVYFVLSFIEGVVVLGRIITSIYQKCWSNE